MGKPRGHRHWSEGYEAVELPTPSEVVTPEVKRQRLLDMAVGKQISRLTEFEDPNPFGGAAVGFMLRTHERPFYWAVPVPPLLSASGFIAAWKPQWFERQFIVTRSMEAEMTRDRMGESFTPNPLYRRLEGCVIQGARFLETPNEWSGETIEFELSDRMALKLHALPGSAHGLASKYSSNYKLELLLPPKRSAISLSEGPRIVRPVFLGTR